MSRVQYYCAASLDGYIAEADDTIDWLTGYEASEPAADVETVEGGYDDFYEGVGALVSGSVTYEWVLAHLDEWPYKGKPCWVLSSRDLPKPDGEGVDFHLSPGEWIRLLRANAFEVEDLIEIYPEEDSTSSFPMVSGSAPARGLASIPISRNTCPCARSMHRWYRRVAR